MENIFEIKNVGHSYDYLAPDGSEIRLLAKINGGGICHCTLPVGKTSAAVKHRSVEEIWYVISGTGEMWQLRNGNSQVVSLQSGTSVTIAVGNSFQFRNTGNESLCILIVTIPNWPGADEAVPVKGLWINI